MTLNKNRAIPDWLNDRIPAYEKAEYIEQAFSDSTHLLWRLWIKEDDGNKAYFLKLCSNTKSPFWEIMHDLFDFDLRQEIASFSQTYAFVDKASSLSIPHIVKAESIQNKGAYILSSELLGRTINIAEDDQQVKQLAKYLAELHSYKPSHSQDSWGTLSNPVFNKSEWTRRLKQTLQRSSEKWGGALLNAKQANHSDKYLKLALEALNEIKPIECVPMMVDLRWDQFLHEDNRLTALVDLDAFVFAPIELDFVILEYLLTREQSRCFIDEYSKFHRVPDIQLEREAYRLLLFYMQILGENDLDVWMNRQRVF